MRIFLLALLLLVLGVSPSNSQSPLLKQIHAFYYMWYGTPEVDGSWKHWDHSVLPHWRQEVTAQHPTVGQRHAPDKEHLHSRFFPMGGPYSSSDPEVVGRHMQWLMAAGVDTVVASWWGPAWRSQSTDGQGVTTDAVLPILLRAAHAHGVRVAFHLEPYPGRTAATVREDVEYLVQQHGGSPALLRVDGKPVYYVYDSYHIVHSDWAELLMPSSKHTLRGGPLDGE
jgi:glycoprotein endo-alpha-1,2-mannosidase